MKMRLSEYLKNSDKALFAEGIGVSRQALHNYISGKHMPNLKTAWIIEEATGGRVTIKELLPEKYNDQLSDETNTSNDLDNLL